VPGGALVGVGAEQPALGEADLAFDLGGGRAPAPGERVLDLRPLLVRQQPFDHAAQVALVVDRVRVGAPEDGGVLAQDPRADGVKRHRGDAACAVFAEQVGES
jgi:hypothetical protein